ncbi:MAG: glycoside hydrolase family 97 protein [Ignavibacteriales bacterium]|nr:glycoside hydrolase family 97 protein [Ignavibacteriales bacterium]
MRYYFLLLFTINILTLNAQQIFSPDKKFDLNFKLVDGKPVYSLNFNKQAIIKESTLGIDLTDQPDFIDGFTIEKIDTSTFFENWNPFWGEQSVITNNYRELKVTLSQQVPDKRILIITFRLFNDGLGFRYEFPQQNNLNYFVVKEEHSTFALSGDHKTFWIPGDYDSQEYTYTTSLLSEVDATKGANFDDIVTKNLPGASYIQTPLMLKTNDGIYINIHEASLLNYPAMYVRVDKNNFSLQSHLCPDAVGNKAYLQTPFTTPWRSIVVSDKAENILESKLILNLNEPTKFKDVSWIKPQKYIGIWWGMHVGTMSWNYGDLNNVNLKTIDWSKVKPNGMHGATTENTKRYIDFAAKYGFNSVLVEGWNVGWEDWFGKWKEEVFDFLTPYPDFDIEYLSNYAKEKNVKLIMHHETSASVTNYERRMDDAFKLMNKYGYESVKTGYVGPIIPRGEHHDSQWMINHFTRVVEKAEKYNICVDSHESVRLTGLHRTYPNWMAAEAARGNEFNAWSNGNPPEHETILPFTRFMGGPMDYTPGIFQIKMDYYKPESKYQVHTTIAKQLALYVVLYSPLQMAADLIENYERFPDAFQFIVDVPVDWSETKVLQAEPGDYIIIARKDKNSDNWFVGAITDEQARDFDVKLDFLSADKYEMTIYKDAPDSDWEKNPMKYEIEKKIVKKSEVLKLKLARSGGCAIMLKPLK